MATAFNLEGRLGLNILKFKNKLNEAEKNVNSFKAKTKKATMAVKKSFDGIRSSVAGVSNVLSLGGALSGAGIVALANNATKAAEEIGQLATTTGSTVREVQGLTVAFKQYKLEADDVGDVLNTIADRAQDAKDGMQSYVDDFGLVGVEVDDLRGKRPAELFNTFADAVAKTEDPVRRQAALVRILGDDLGRKLAPALMGGSAQFAAITAEAEKAGIIMSAGVVQGAISASRSMEKLKTVVGGGVNKVFAQMGPFIDLVSQKLVNFINSSADFDSIFNKALMGSVKVLGLFADGWRGIEVLLAAAKVAALGFTSAFTGVINGALTLTAEFGNAVKDFMTAPLREMLEMASKLPIVGDKIKGVLTTIEDFEFRPPELATDVFNSQVDAMKLAATDLHNKLMEPLPSDNLTEWVEGVKVATATMHESANSAEAMRVKIAATSTSVGDSLGDMKAQADAFGSQMRSTLGTEITGILDGNFQNIGDSFKSMLKNMVAQAIAADIANAIGLGGAPAAGGGGGGMLAGAGQFISGFFAEGGNPPMNKAAIVGEDGPEMFVPKQAGTVIPNDKIGGGGSTVVNNFNISTPDANSFRSSRSKIANDMARVVR